MEARRQLTLRRFAQNPGALVGGYLVLVALLCAVLAPLLAPSDPTQGDLAFRLAKPSWMPGAKGHFWLGADAVGRDVLSRIIYGSRISLFVGGTSVLISMVLGVPAGLIAGYFGGTWDTVLMRIADLWLSLPFILLAVLIMAVFGGGLGKLIAVLGITGWVGYARLVRSQVLVVRELDFVIAARALGLPELRILWRHVLPNVLSSVIVLGTLQVANNMLLEAGLTFLGLGVDPSIPTWGGMLADGRQYITTAWWVSTFPGLAIMLTVLGINLLGDWLRDELDPQLRF